MDRFRGKEGQYFPARVAVTSDDGKVIAFVIKDLVETFQSKVLSQILDLCAEDHLHLVDDDYDF